MSNTNRSVRFSLFGKKYYFTLKVFLWVILLFTLFIYFGCWQLKRAQHESDLLQTYTARITGKPISLTDIEDASQDWRFYPIHLEGAFDNAHTILIDRKVYQGESGYDVITPLKMANSSHAILVNRGWIPLDKNKDVLPTIEPIVKPVIIEGTLDVPVIPFLARSSKADQQKWPLVVHHLNTEVIAEILGYRIFPYVVLLNSDSANGFAHDWKPNTALSGRYTLYAIQWFSLAAALFIVFLAFNIYRAKD